MSPDGSVDDGECCDRRQQFKAVNTRDKNFTSGKVERRRAQLEKSVARYLAQLDTAELHEPSEELAAKTAHLKEKLVKLESEMQRLAAMERLMPASPDQQISLTDPDSRAMATSGRGSGVVGYNVQIAVDTEHHLIVTDEVTNDGYRCPAGEKLKYHYTNEEHGQKLRRYWTNACRDCVLKPRCTTGKERRITRWEREQYWRLSRSASTRTRRPCACVARRPSIPLAPEDENGSDALLDETPPEGCHPDGTARARLQPHPRDPHHGSSAADGRNQGIVRAEHPSHVSNLPRCRPAQRSVLTRPRPKDGVIGRPSLWIAEDFGCCASG